MCSDELRAKTVRAVAKMAKSYRDVLEGRTDSEEWYGRWGGHDNCALCVVYFNRAADCTGCPLHTGGRLSLHGCIEESFDALRRGYLGPKERLLPLVHDRWLWLRSKVLEYLTAEDAAWTWAGLPAERS
jgi:hypothetical protein